MNPKLTFVFWVWDRLELTCCMLGVLPQVGELESGGPLESVEDRINLAMYKARVNQLEAAKTRVAGEVTEMDWNTKELANRVEAQLTGKAPPPPSRRPSTPPPSSSARQVRW